MSCPAVTSGCHTTSEIRISGRPASLLRLGGLRAPPPATSLHVCCKSTDTEILSCPREQYGGEIRRVTPLFVRIGQCWRRSCLRFDDFPVEMPGGVAKHGHHHGEAEK